MKIFNWLAELRYRNGILYKVGLVHFILFVLLLAIFAFDSREVLGINTWIKPMKFAISIGIYTWTFGWILFDLTVKKKWIKIISWTIAISMMIEIFIILYQASRATRSHFNFDTVFDGVLFGVMGIMILINTVMVVVVLLLFLFGKPKLEKVYLLSLRLGLVLFLVSNYVGKVMIDSMAHSVGGEDGAEGIPFFNWSKEAGDLRVAHFMGLHAIQIIPLFAHYLNKKTNWSQNARMVAVGVFTIAYAGIFSMLYYQALMGQPLISN